MTRRYLLGILCGNKQNPQFRGMGVNEVIDNKGRETNVYAADTHNWDSLRNVSASLQALNTNTQAHIRVHTTQNRMMLPW